jgi:hypothetical protein
MRLMETSGSGVPEGSGIGEHVARAIREVMEKMDFILLWDDAIVCEGRDQGLIALQGEVNARLYRVCVYVDRVVGRRRIVLCRYLWCRCITLDNTIPQAAPMYTHSYYAAIPCPIHETNYQWHSGSPAVPQRVDKHQLKQVCYNRSP